LNSFKFDDQRSLGEWSHDNAADHRDIARLILAQKSVYMTDYVLDPIAPQDFENWLWRHQTLHDEMNSVLSLSGYDLSSVNPNDPQQMESWLRLHFDEHNRAHLSLGF
jgi:hypothetical protein